MATILIVDDAELICRVVGIVLTRAGHEVLTATDGDAALELFRQRPIGMVISDLLMPGRSGLDVLHEIRRLSPTTPVIIMTAAPSVEAAVACLKCGASEFLEKPVAPARLCEVVNATLAAAAGSLATVIMPAHASLRAVGGYRVVSLLGTGGYGMVYLAEHAVGHVVRQVALKVLRNPVDGTSRDRFAREALVIAHLSHPNIVRIMEFDISPAARVPYIAMEYVAGRTLHDLEDDQTPTWDYPRRVEVLRQLAEALAAVHAHGVYHRDIKPHNVLVTADLDVKLTDFGMVRTGDSTLTEAGDLLGTPAYMAPEIIASRTADARADLFSFGVLAYELLVGQRPFTGDSLLSLAQAIGTAAPPRPRALAPTLPEPLERILGRLLRKSPAERYASAASVAADLRAFLAGAPPRSVTPLPAGAAADWADPAAVAATAGQPCPSGTPAAAAAAPQTAALAAAAAAPLALAADVLSVTASLPRLLAAFGTRSAT